MFPREGIVVVEGPLVRSLTDSVPMQALVG